jgi:hypothetical protein
MPASQDFATRMPRSLIASQDRQRRRNCSAACASLVSVLSGTFGISVQRSLSEAKRTGLNRANDAIDLKRTLICFNTPPNFGALLLNG